MSEPVGSIIIVTHNSGRHIEACLGSVRESGWEQIVVDNASMDGSPGRAREFMGAVVHVNDCNRGFAVAACQGARLARGRLFLFLNPDTIAEPGALASLEKAAQPENVAAVGGRLVNPDGTTQIGFTVRRFPTLSSALAELLLLNRLFPANPWNRRYRCLDFPHDEPGEVDQPAGACLLVKREAWSAVGGFDESFYPLWFEDVDLCRRLRGRGWRIVYEPAARFRHVGGHSLAGMAPHERELSWYANFLRYFRKHHGRGAAALLRVGILGGMLLRMGITLLGAPRGAESRRACLAAYGRVVRRCVFGSIA